MNEANTSPSPEPGKKKKSPALALALAFLPSVYLLGMFTIYGKANPPIILLFIGCLVAVFCCLTSAVLLFNHKTVLTIVVGVLFLILNLYISLMFGCGVVFFNAFSHP